MFYKLQDGDEIKIIPFFDKQGNIQLTKEYGFMYIDNGIVIDDQSRLLYRLVNYDYYNSTPMKRKPFTMSNIFMIWHDNQLKFISASRKLTEILIHSIDIRSNKHIKIVNEMINSPIGFLPNYEKSYSFEKEWNCPVADINSKEEWTNFIKENQNFYIEDYIEENNVFKKIDIVRKEFGDNFNIFLSELRDKKLNKVLEELS